MDWNTTSAWAERLSRLESFDGLSRRDIRRVIKTGTTVQVAAGDELVREGEPGIGVYLLISGDLDVSQRGQRIGAVHAGELIGEISLLERVPATATLTAATDCEALHLAYDDVRRLLDDTPAIRRAVLSTAHHRLERDRHRE